MAEPSPRPTIAVGAVVMSDGRLLMVRRGKEPGRGLWSLPGGAVEPGEYLADAVRREVAEETGVEVEVGSLLGIFEVVGPTTHHVIHDYVATTTGEPVPRPGDDADEARWVPLDEVTGLQTTPRFVETLTAWGVLVEPTEPA